MGSDHLSTSALALNEMMNPFNVLGKDKLPTIFNDLSETKLPIEAGRIVGTAG